MSLLASESMELSAWSLATLAKHTLLGTVGVGLLIAALYSAFYLLRLSRLPKQSREYRQLSYHLESETLLRYVITIACLVLLNILVYVYIEAGRTCFHIGVAVWGAYFLVSWLRDQVRALKRA